jgi:hypothetical protein
MKGSGVRVPASALLLREVQGLRGAPGRDDLAQDLLEHGVALLADELGPATPDSGADRLRGFAGLAAALRGDDALGPAVV